MSQIPNGRQVSVDSGWFTRLAEVLGPQMESLDVCNGEMNVTAIERVLQDDRLVVEHRRSLPPMGMMTLLVLRKI